VKNYWHPVAVHFFYVDLLDYRQVQKKIRLVGSAFNKNHFNGGHINVQAIIASDNLMRFLVAKEQGSGMIF
jgi:hypothetical protein